jgi:hypothetical protein
VQLVRDEKKMLYNES